MQKVVFSTLDDFLIETKTSDLKSVRLDLFENVSDTEFSFVYYHSIAVHVTAYYPLRHMVYEYAEPVLRVASAKLVITDSEVKKGAADRLDCIRDRLVLEGFEVLRGRFTAPSFLDYRIASSYMRT